MSPAAVLGSVLVTQPIHRSALTKLTDAGYIVTDLASPVPLTAEQIAEQIGSAQALVCHLTDRVDEHVLSHPGLRVVATVSAGMDHIDLDAATRHAVRVVNTPDVLTEATAGLAFALLLAVARRITESDALVRGGGFHGWRLMDELMGADLHGSTLGVIGFGRIGQAVAHRARAFGMSVLYHARHSRPELPEHLAARHVPLPELLTSSDFVSLHAPLTEATRHLIDAEALALMRPHAYLINTSRGALIDEAALAQALAAGDDRGRGPRRVRERAARAPGVAGTHRARRADRPRGQRHHRPHPRTHVPLGRRRSPARARRAVGAAAHAAVSGLKGAAF